MAGIPELLIAVGGLSLTLGIGGALWSLVCRIPKLDKFLDEAYHNLPMGRKEVQELSRKRHSCKH